MSERFFLEQPIVDARAVLAGAEAHHLIHVLRGRVGQRVTLFDGSGQQYAAEIRQVGRSEVQLAVLAAEAVDRELSAVVTLGVALPKGDRQRWLVEKAVELGVARIVPLRTARAVAQPVSQALQRLQRAVVEASKQCGRNRLLELGEPQDWDEFLPSVDPLSQRFLAHFGRAAQRSDRRPAPALTPGRAVVFAVGPEGGFTAEEAGLAESAGWKVLSLGPRILRVETAALLLAALAAQEQVAEES